MNSKTAHRCKGQQLALLLLLTIMLPSCGQAEEADTSQQAATDPIQVAQAQPGSSTSGGSTGGSKPNILVVWGDDIGYWNVSAYNQGMMGYETAGLPLFREDPLAILVR